MFFNAKITSANQDIIKIFYINILYYFHFVINLGIISIQ